MGSILKIDFFELSYVVSVAFQSHVVEGKLELLILLCVPLCAGLRVWATTASLYVMPGIKPRASCMLDKQALSAAELYPLSLQG